MSKRWVPTLMLLLILDRAAAEPDHGTGANSPTPEAVTPAVAVDTLKSELNKPISSDWWKAVRRILDRLEKPEADRLLEVLDGDAKRFFSESISARFVKTPEVLKLYAESGGKTPEDLASQDEWDRRLKEDPNIALIARLFKERPESALIHEDELRRAIEKEDEAAAADVVVKLLFSLNEDQREEAFKDLEAERKKEEVQNNPRRLKQVDRFLWAIQEIKDAPRDGSAVANRFKDKVTGALEKMKERSDRFYTELDKAAKGDQTALRGLLDRHGQKALIDFMVGQGGEVGEKLARSLGWTDVKGNVHLDVKTNEHGAETWTLGDDKEEISKSLDAFASRGGHAVLDSPTRRNFQKVDDNKKVVSHDPKVLAPEDRKLCSPDDPLAASRRSVALSGPAGWFFRPFPNSAMGSYAGGTDHTTGSPSSPTNNSNRVVDLNTGREIPMPGPYDPVPTTDELYMTVPLDKGLAFYDMKSIVNGKPEEIFVDEKMGGVYQSIGELSKLENGISSYRIITDLNGLSYRDYEVSRGPGGSATVRPLGDGPKQLCADKKLSLPMISKDGKLLAAVDLSTNTTKIFNIENGKCEEKIDLKMFTSKVDFSFDKKKITFHKQNNESLFKSDSPYTKIPSDSYVSNIYTYDLESGEISRLTDYTNQNGVYPAFQKDGKITFIEHPHRGDGEAKPSNLVTVDPNLARKVSFDHFLPKSAARPDREDKLKASAALGGLFNQLCSQFGDGVSKESAVLSTLNLNADRCKELVDKYWDSLKGSQSLTREEVAAACPTKPVEAPPPPSVPPPGNPGTEQAVPSSCRHCHRPGTAYPIPFDDPAQVRGMTARNGAKLVDEIFRRVGSTDPTLRMPPGGEDQALTSAEIERLRKHLAP